jgi:Mn2+/Fe2+ NRAMP family transporter
VFITAIPSFLVILFGLNTFRILILSQVVLSIQLPFTLVPLLILCRNRNLMGDFRSGEPEAAILEDLQGKDYDLVAMATHGHALLADILLGSVSRGLKHKVGIPLLLLRSSARARRQRNDKPRINGAT